MSDKVFWREISDGLKLVRANSKWNGEEMVAWICRLLSGRYGVYVIPPAHSLLGGFTTQAEAKAWVEQEMGPLLKTEGYEVDFDKVRPLPGRSKK